MVVSPELGELLEKHFNGDIGALEWVPNMVDPMFCRAEGRQNLTADRIRLLNVAGLTVRKGHATLLRAVRQSIDSGCDVELRVAGSGPERRAIESQIRALELDDRVTLLGRIGREAVLSEMHACDALVVSSYCETFGVVLIEAMACGKPVVATACGGPECVVDQSNGLLVQPGDESALATAFLELQRNNQRFDPDAIRRNCLNRFGEQALTDRLSRIYSTALCRQNAVEQPVGLAA
jgi:glycosyltransferase involved in cell wall biosynthesis